MGILAAAGTLSVVIRGPAEAWRVCGCAQAPSTGGWGRSETGAAHLCSVLQTISLTCEHALVLGSYLPLDPGTGAIGTRFF
ncbi:hypothetical protein SDC9_170800 [bioreactor metagenome]|uniref:Uncharacterized protein n=1 Tax=bioreactor metagenome TaxID=1076179 RepID=A0A645GBP7_9ZZZZ